MKLHAITLNIQTTPTATPQLYKGPQIIKLLDLQLKGNKIIMYVWADETLTQECEQYVQKLDQPLMTKDGQPILQSAAPIILQDANGKSLINTPKGVVLVSSYCFA